MHIHKIAYIETFKISPTCFDPKIIFRELCCSLLKSYKGTVQLPEDDLRIETCWRDFKCFNVNSFMYVCIKSSRSAKTYNYQLFTSAQHLLLLIIGLHVSTDHSVIFSSLICCKFQGAVHTFGIPIVFTLKLNPFISAGG